MPRTYINRNYPIRLLPSHETQPQKTQSLLGKFWDWYTSSILPVGTKIPMLRPAGDIMPVNPPQISEVTPENKRAFDLIASPATLTSVATAGISPASAIGRGIGYLSGGLQALHGAEEIGQGETGSGLANVALGALPFATSRLFRRLPEPVPKPEPAPEFPLPIYAKRTANIGQNRIYVRGQEHRPYPLDVPTRYRTVSPEEEAFNALIPERFKGSQELTYPGVPADAIGSRGTPFTYLEEVKPKPKLPAPVVQPRAQEIPTPEIPKPEIIKPTDPFAGLSAKERRAIQKLKELSATAGKPLSDDEIVKMLGLDKPKPKISQPKKVSVPKETSESLSVPTIIETPKNFKQVITSWYRNRKAADIEGRIIRNQFEKYRNLGLQGILDVQRTDAYPDIRKYFDDLFDLAKQHGIEMDYVQHYLPQLWKNKPEEIYNILATRGIRVRSKPGFSLKRVIEDYETGIQLGLTPRFDNLPDLIGWAEQNVKKAIADKQLFNYLKAYKLVIPTEKAPATWRPLDPQYFPMIISKEGGGKSWSAPAHIARIINDRITPASGAFENLARTFRYAKNITLSGGVPWTGINWHGIVNMPYRAARAYGLTHPIEAAKGVSNQYLYAVWPKAAKRFLDNNLDHAKDYIKRGLTLGVEGFWSLVGTRENIPRTAIGRLWDNFERAFSEVTFGYVIPATKLRYAMWQTNNLMKSGVPRDEAMEIASRAANNFFGGIEKALASREVENIKTLFLLAPDWFETKYQIGKNTARALLNPKSKEGQIYLNAAASALATMLIARQLRKMITGQEPPTLGRTGNIPIPALDLPGKVAEIDISGAAGEDIELPMRIIGDIMDGKVPFDTLVRFARYNTSVIFGAVADMLAGEDIHGAQLRTYGKFGRQIPRGEQLANITSVIANTFLPQPVQAGIDYATGRLTGREAAAQALEMPVRWYRRRRYIPSRMRVVPVRSLGEKF
jgi:hypothetical protein